MDISFPLWVTAAVLAVPVAAAAAFSGGSGGGSGSGSGSGSQWRGSGSGSGVGGGSGGSGSGRGVGDDGNKGGSMNNSIEGEAVLLLSLLTLHPTVIQIQILMTNSLMHYQTPMVSNVKLKIWVLNLIILT